MANEGSGANRSRSAAQLLAQLLTVDGAGSGLDADLLDGITSSGFVQTTGAQTIAGVKTFSDGMVVAADLVFSVTPWLVRANTVDGADNLGMRLAAGGAFSTTRGACIDLYGNENASHGLLRLLAGDDSGNGTIQFNTAGTTWTTLQRDGTLAHTGQLTLSDLLIQRSGNANQNGITSLSTVGSSSSGGGYIRVGNDDGAAMAANDRLGGYRFSGAIDGASTIVSGALIAAQTTEAWDSTHRGTKLIFQVTANATTTQVDALTIDQNKSATFVSTVSADDFRVTTNTNGFNFGHDTASKFMIVGYGAVGTTNFGDVRIYDGKTSPIAVFKGATGALLIGSTTDDGVNKLQLTGLATMSDTFKTVDNATVQMRSALKLGGAAVGSQSATYGHLYVYNSSAAEIFHVDSFTPSVSSAAALTITTGASNGIIMVRTDAYGLSGGPSLSLRTDDGTAMTSGNSLGGVFFQARRDASNMTAAARLGARATQLWTNTAAGTKLEFETTPNGSTTRAVVLTLDQDGTATFTAGINATTVTASAQVIVNGNAGLSLNVTNGVAPAAVAITIGNGPTGSTAGNPLGFLRVRAGGTDRYIPYW